MQRPSTVPEPVWRRPIVRAYAGAILCAVVATSIRACLNPWLGERVPWVFYYPALALVAWSWGTGPALACLVLSALMGTMMFMPPLGTLEPHSFGEGLVLLSYLVSGLAIAAIGGANQRAHKRLTLEAKRRDRAQRELAESLEQYRGIVDSARNDAIILMDADRKILSWNPGAEEILGWPAEEAIGMMADMIFVAEDVEANAPKQEAETAAVYGRAMDERWHRRMNGERFWGSGTLTALHHRDGRIRGYLKVIRDATERKRLEELLVGHNEELERRVRERTADLLAANAELEGFAYSVSHDMRTPLRGIIGNSAILLADYGPELSDDARERLQRLAGAARKMSELVEDLLTYARLGKQQPKMTETDMSRLFAEVAAEEAQGIDAEIFVEPGLNAFCDPGLMRMVLSNLVGNSIKYRSPVRPLKITFSRVDGEFEVEDNGIGFDMAYIDKLFKPFERLHRDEDVPGTGIGLANVRRIIERQGGKVRAQGELGKGARFYFTLGGDGAL